MAPLFYIDHIGQKSVKIFLFETRRHRPLIIGLYIHLIGLYRGCSDYSPGINNDHAKGVSCFTQTALGKTEKKTSCVKLEDLDRLYLTRSVIC